MKKEGEVPRIALDSMGCKLNQAEIEVLAQQFREAGYKLVSPTGRADAYILKTCTVTSIADRKARYWFRMAHRRNPDALLVATGCYAERAPQELSRIDGIEVVVGNGQKQNLLKLLEKRGLVGPGGDMVDDARSGFRTRTFVKIQDGCNDFCSYCIVPLVRGRERSLPIDRVLNDVKQKIANGYQEVVLTGVKIGSYNCEGTDLRGLIERVLAETSIVRLRLSSLQPQEISPELIALWCDDRLCRHFHLSLQSGSDDVLKRMKRRYSTDDYLKTIFLMKAMVPGAAITTDLIVGFPGEASADFTRSYKFCKEAGFARIHVFSYSPREWTQASCMPQQIEARVKKQRSRKMLALALESAQSFRRQFLGEVMAVLWEKRSGDEIWSGLTDNYIKVYTSSNEDLTNKVIPTRITELFNDDGVWGEKCKVAPE